MCPRKTEVFNNTKYSRHHVNRLEQRLVIQQGFFTISIWKLHTPLEILTANGGDIPHREQDQPVQRRTTGDNPVFRPFLGVLSG